MDMTDLKDYVAVSKDALDLLKAAYGALPKGSQRDEIEKKVEVAAALLARSDAKLAKDLGYKMCQCTFPPQVMLWREAEKAWICQNENCGAKVQRVFTREAEEQRGGRLAAARPGYGRK